MEDKQTYRLIFPARIFNKPILATVITMIGSRSFYAILHHSLKLATPLGQGIAVAVAIAAKISVESQVGVGSQFHIYLPLIS